MRRISVALMLCWLAAIAGPAGAGPYSADAKRSGDPDVYVIAFQDIISIRLIEATVGKTYSVYRNGDLKMYGMPRGGFATCQMSDLPTGWLDRPNRCRIAHLNPLPGCRSEDGCVSLRVAPDVLIAYRREILQAVQSPCRYLEDPKALFRDRDRRSRNRELRSRTKSVGYSIAQEWDIFHCDRETPVAASRTVIDDAAGVITIWF